MLALEIYYSFISIVFKLGILRTTWPLMNGHSMVLDQRDVDLVKPLAFNCFYFLELALVGKYS